MTEELTNYNQQMIEQFRANGGQDGRRGPEARSCSPRPAPRVGACYLNPLAAYADDGRLFVVASKAGAPRNPDWYHNLVANPTVTVEHDGEKFDATAPLLPDDERDPLFRGIVEQAAQFGEYQEKTSRKIPLVELARLHGSSRVQRLRNGTLTLQGAQQFSGASARQPASQRGRREGGEGRGLVGEQHRVDEEHCLHSRVVWRRHDRGVVDEEHRRRFRPRARVHTIS